MWLTLGLLGLGALLFFAGRKVERHQIEAETAKQRKVLHDKAEAVLREVDAMSATERDRWVYGPGLRKLRNGGLGDK